MTLPTVFEGDCGFQTKIWVTNVTGSLFHQENYVALAWVQPYQAEEWRAGFISYLLRTDSGMNAGKCLLSGGAPNSDPPVAQLDELLQTHGVPRAESLKRAQDVIANLGRHLVSTCMRSSKAWRDLKAKANTHVPKLQLILPGELADKLKDKAMNGPPLRSKKPQKHTKRRLRLQVMPEDISIPEGIFQTPDQKTVAQATITHMIPEAPGVVAVQYHEAKPFLQMARQISSKGLALLILDYRHDELHQCGEVARFPARSTSTSEPMIVSAKVVEHVRLLEASPLKSMPWKKQTQKSSGFMLTETSWKCHGIPLSCDL